MRRTLLMIAAVALLLTQCRKPAVELPTAEPTNENMVSMTVTVGHGRTLIDADGTITWSKNDKLYVGDGSKYIGCLTLQGAGGSATGTFTGSVSTTTSTTFGFYYLGSNPPEVADNETSVDISFAEQDGRIGNLSDCHIGYGTATGKVEGTSVVLDTNPVQMTSKVAIAYFEFKDGETPYEGRITLSGANICNSMTVGFDGSFAGTDGTAGEGISLTDNTSSQKYVMLVPPAYVAEETLNFGGGAEGSTKFYKGIEANKFYCLGEGDPIAVKVEKVKPFTVGMDNDKPRRVEFSPGNLQYLGKSDGSGTWRFADRQWDYMGDGPSSGTVNQGNVNLTSLGYTAGMYNSGSAAVGGSETEADKKAARDLFGWGCTGYQDTRMVNHTNWYQTNYRPYSTSYKAGVSTDPAYSINCYGYGPDYYVGSKYGLTVENKSDWGCLKIGDDPANTWRTLSKDEWKYLLDTRTTKTWGLPDASSRYAKVTVDGVKGLLLFPDSFAWTSAMGTAPTATNTQDAAFTTGSYTAAEFTEQEKSGVVFLPAAGHRNSTNIWSVGDIGYYWSCSCEVVVYGSLSTGAHNICIRDIVLVPQQISGRGEHYSVRLVR